MVCSCLLDNAARGRTQPLVQVNIRTLPADPKFVVGKPNVLNQELFLERVQQILTAAIHTNDGPFVRQLEDLVQKTLEVPYCLALSNATLALELLLQSLAVSGEVIVPSFTFVASVHSIVRSNLQPVFCDVDSRGLMDCDHLERLLNEKTACIMPVNVYGYVCNTRRIQELADKYSIPVIYDSAHALGVKQSGRSVGGFGTAEVFSLHATKFISGFEGGLITTHSAEIAQRLRKARNFGFVGYDAVESVGTNAKLSEIHAAMALTNLERINDIVIHNKLIFETYSRTLVSPLSLIAPLAEESPNYQYVPVVCPADLREHILAVLLENQIFARRYFYPGTHQMQAYKHLDVHLPNTESLAESIICLPTGIAISTEDAQAIANIANMAAKAPAGRS